MSSQPRRSARIAAKMAAAQPVIPSQQSQPRRSPRLAVKRHAIMISQARHFLLPLFDQLEHTRCHNSRAHLILQIINYLIIFPNILIWNPKFRGTVSVRINHIWNQVKDSKVIDKNNKNNINECFKSLQQTLVDIQSHPDYVS